MLSTGVQYMWTGPDSNPNRCSNESKRLLSILRPLLYSKRFLRHRQTFTTQRILPYLWMFLHGSFLSIVMIWFVLKEGLYSYKCAYFYKWLCIFINIFWIVQPQSRHALRVMPIQKLAFTIQVAFSSYRSTPNIKLNMGALAVMTLSNLRLCTTTNKLIQICIFLIC